MCNTADLAAVYLFITLAIEKKCISHSPRELRQLKRKSNNICPYRGEDVLRWFLIGFFLSATATYQISRRILKEKISSLWMCLRIYVNKYTPTRGFILFSWRKFLQGLCCVYIRKFASNKGIFLKRTMIVYRPSDKIYYRLLLISSGSLWSLMTVSSSSKSDIIQSEF